MARNKLYSRKKRYAKAWRTNLPVPTWVTMRSKRKVQRHPGERSWRENSIKR